MEDADHHGNSSQYLLHEPIQEHGEQLKRKDYILGIGLLLMVVILWTSSNFLTQDLYEGGYTKPFLVTYLNTGAFAFYLLPWLFKHARSAKSKDSDRSRGYEAIAVTDVLEIPTSSLQTTFRAPSIYSDVLGNLANKADDLSPLTVRETAKLASIFCLFWFVANWSVNASLEYTSVASATILSSMSGFFTLAIGRIFKVETLSLAKIGAVVTSFLGVLLVSVSDTGTRPVSEVPAGSPHLVSPTPDLFMLSHFTSPILGDSLAILSAVFYALYVILLKVRIKEESRIDMQLFFGFVGLFNVLLLWPIGVLLHLTGGELLELPHGRRAWAAVLINMAITVISDYIYVLAMLKTTPLVVTVGLSLTIPLAIIGDFFLNIPTATQAIIGAFLVLGSFVVVGVENSNVESNAGPKPAVLGGEVVDDQQEST